LELESETGIELQGTGQQEVFGLLSWNRYSLYEEGKLSEELPEELDSGTGKARDESEESGLSSIDRLSSAHEEDEELSSLSYPEPYDTNAHLYVGW
jgi:hypothetical protein